MGCCCGTACCRASLSFFSLAAFILSIVAAFSCDFANRIVETYIPLIGSTTTWFGVGFMGRSVHGDLGDSNLCTGWTSEEKDLLFDSSWVAGWSFALIAFALGLIAMVMSFLFICMDMGNKIYCCMVCFYVFIGICQALTFICFNSELFDFYEPRIDFHFGVGAGCAAAATLIWFFCALLAGLSQDRDQKEEDTQEEVAAAVVASVVDDSKGPQPTVEETVTVNEDGSRVIEKVTTYPDGSKEITTTTENPV